MLPSKHMFFEVQQQNQLLISFFLEEGSCLELTVWCLLSVINVHFLLPMLKMLKLPVQWLTIYEKYNTKEAKALWLQNVLSLL